MAKTIKDIQNTLDQLLSDAAAEKEALSRQIEADKAAADKATKDMDAVIVTGDLKAFQAAKAARNDAADALEMHTKKLQRMEKEPLMTPAAAAEVKKQVKDLVAVSDNALSSKLVKLAEDAEKLCKEFEKVAHEGEEVMQTMRKIEKKESEIYNAESVTSWSNFHWGMKLVRDNRYTDKTGRRVPQ